MQVETFEMVYVTSGELIIRGSRTEMVYTPPTEEERLTTDITEGDLSHLSRVNGTIVEVEAPNCAERLAIIPR